MKIIVTFISDYKALISNYLIIISMAAQTIIQYDMVKSIKSLIIPITLLKHADPWK